ncbi:tRNA1(Val) (adenine(37)-N6)-methyltransferase [Candidatus Poribacteria bacterium]|nr:tRNA1(Val) (adenine(37)-N6)-methyltransferase [Candidatus Poribacteria bacterium]
MCVRVKEDEVIDTIISPRLKVIQKRKGPKFAVDAVLLAQFTKVSSGDRVVDLGTGTGVIPLILAHTTKAGQIIGVEIQTELADMAGRSVLLNGLQKRVEIIEGDIRRIADILPAGRFDVVTCNPPHRSPETGRVSPNPAIAISRHEILGRLEDFVAAAGYLLKNRGRAVFVHRPERLPDLLELFRREEIAPKRLRFVHPMANRNAELLLLEGIKKAGEGMIILPPLFLSDEEGS